MAAPTIGVAGGGAHLNQDGMSNRSSSMFRKGDDEPLTEGKELSIVESMENHSLIDESASPKWSKLNQGPQFESKLKIMSQESERPDKKRQAADTTEELSEGCLSAADRASITKVNIIVRNSHNTHKNNN